MHTKLLGIPHGGLKFWLGQDSTSESMLTNLNHQARILAWFNQLILHFYHEKLYVMISLQSSKTFFSVTSLIGIFQ